MSKLFCSKRGLDYLLTCRVQIRCYPLKLLNVSILKGFGFKDLYFLLTQAVAQVRTVYSYVGESKTLNSYSDAISETLKLGYKAGIAKGLGIGCTYGIACMSWALVFWYAGVFIRNGQTDGGKAFTAIFSAIVGGM